MLTPFADEDGSELKYVLSFRNASDPPTRVSNSGTSAPIGQQFLTMTP